MKKDIIPMSEATRNLYSKRFLVPCAGLEMTISSFKQKML